MQRAAALERIVEARAEVSARAARLAAPTVSASSASASDALPDEVIQRGGWMKKAQILRDAVLSENWSRATRIAKAYLPNDDR